MPRGADVVVVGGGIIGVSVAYYLAKRGVEVALVDQGDIASGTSSHCMAGLQLCTKTIGPKLELAIEGIRLHHGLEEELGEDLEFRESGGWIVAQNEAEADFVASRVAEYVRAGVDMEFVEKSDCHARQPVLADHVTGSLYSPRDCLVNPLYLTMAFMRQAQRLGASIYPFHRVTGLELRDHSICSVTTDAGEIPTHSVVNATGPWAPNIAQMAGLNLPIVPRRGQILVTEPAPPLWNGLILSADYLLSKKMPSSGSDIPGPMLSGVVTNQVERGNCLIGSTRCFAGYDIRNTYEGIQALARNSARLIPAIAELHIIRSYAGLRPATPDGLPIIERSTKVPGFITAAGHEGDAICLGPITGLRVAELITGGIEDEVLAPFATRRFDSSEKGHCVSGRSPDAGCRADGGRHGSRSPEVGER